MAVNDLYRVEVYQNVGSELTMNVFHVRETVSMTAPEKPQESVVELAAELYLLWAELLSEDWRVTTIRAQRASPAGGIPATTVFGGVEPIVGQVVSEIVPSQAAILISLYSETSNRTGRGRQYLPGCAESIQNEGQLLATPYNANRAALEDFYTDEHGPYLGGTAKFRFNIWASPAAPSDSHDVVSAYLHPNLATQRRRRNFPGFGA